MTGESIPESLCGNPEALITPRGFTEKRPCGFWESEGLGWCNSKDFNDWIAAYKTRIDRGLSQFKDLVKWKKTKLLELTEEEKGYGILLEEHKFLWKALQEQSYKTKDMSSQDYAKYISDVIVKAKELNCLIEDIQTAIVNADGLFKPTGILEGSRQKPTSTWTYAGYGAGLIAALWVYKKIS